MRHNTKQYIETAVCFHLISVLFFFFYFFFQLFLFLLRSFSVRLLTAGALIRFSSSTFSISIHRCDHELQWFFHLLFFFLSFLQVNICATAVISALEYLWMHVSLIGSRFMSPSWCNTFNCFIHVFCRCSFPNWVFDEVDHPLWIQPITPV